MLESRLQYYLVWTIMNYVVIVPLYMKLNTDFTKLDDVIADLTAGTAVRTFTVLSRSWYYDAVSKLTDYYDEVGFSITYYSDEGMTEDGIWGECSFRWEKLDKGEACKFHAFDDSWKILPLFSDVLAAMPSLSEEDDDRKLLDHNGYKTTPSVEMVAEMLERLGVKDITRVEQ